MVSTSLLNDIKFAALLPKKQNAANLRAQKFMK
jgi:hypothetical protein